MIPQTSTEIQEGLYLHEYKQAILGKEYLRRKLYSAENYCFYSAEEKIYDEEGNEISEEEILPNQRTYMTQINLSITDSTLAIDELNKQYISVKKEKDFNII